MFQNGYFALEGSEYVAVPVSVCTTKMKFESQYLIKVEQQRYCSKLVQILTVPETNKLYEVNQQKIFFLNTPPINSKHVVILI